jgi:methionyl-tRNA formyltransferase
VIIVFFGTPAFAAEILRYLLESGVDVAAVVTQPDRPKGRSLHLTPSPVKLVALEKGLPILQPEKASNESFINEIAAFHAALFVVVAFGQILSQKLLDAPALGCINVHASLLPKYRGAAPIQRAIMAGDPETGIAIQKMVRQLDAGDVIAVAKTPIPQEMTFVELEEKLIALTKPLLLGVIHEYEKRIPPGEPQNHELATYASKIELEEGEVKWDRSAQEIHNLIRAFSPRPGAWCWILVGSEKKRLKILRSQSVSGTGHPGKILSPEGVVACGSGALKLIEVQPEGKKAMKAADWLRGCQAVQFIRHLA